jgi:hypothetical protein
VSFIIAFFPPLILSIILMTFYQMMDGAFYAQSMNQILVYSIECWSCFTHSLGGFHLQCLLGSFVPIPSFSA